MPTRELLAPSQRAQFNDFTAPLDDRTLARFYTLSDTELELIRRRHRRASTQLSFAVQLGYARLPGRVLRVGVEAHRQEPWIASGKTVSISEAPPSTCKVWPVIQLASFEHSRATALPISAGVPMRPIGVGPATLVPRVRRVLHRLRKTVEYAVVGESWTNGIDRDTRFASATAK
jgi:hypothetical protein